MTQTVAPKAIFFDWDGTLVDSFGFLHEAHNYTLSQFGRPNMTLEQFSGYFGQPREKLYAEIYGVENIEAAKGHFETFVYAHHVTHLEPAEGAEALLEVVKGLNIPCGVVTNKKRELVEKEIHNYGWEHFFDVVVGAGDAGEDKPSPKPLKLAINKSAEDIDIQSIYYVGDTENDLGCANAVGCVTILIAEEEKQRALLELYDVNEKFNNCAEFTRFLLQYKA